MMRRLAAFGGRRRAIRPGKKTSLPSENIIAIHQPCCHAITNDENTTTITTTASLLPVCRYSTAAVGAGHEDKSSWKSGENGLDLRGRTSRWLSVKDWSQPSSSSFSKQNIDRNNDGDDDHENVENPLEDPWAITEDLWTSKQDYDDLPDWSPQAVSRFSTERVTVTDIPTLTELAASAPSSSLPKQPLWSQDKQAYEAFRAKCNADHIAEQVRVMAEPRIDAILRLPTWEDKQDAVDELFESIEMELKEKEEVLGLHPQFGTWVETSLERYLEGIQQREQQKLEQASSVEPPAESPQQQSSTGQAGGDLESRGHQKDEQESTSGPVFMDCYSNDDGPDLVVPKILSPLKKHPRDGVGRMVEEWELAAHKSTRRILIRECTREAARVLTQHESSRILFEGHAGAGKTAVLASIVASARKSGNIVLFLPDGNKLRRIGYYIEPNPKREGVFDLPILTQEYIRYFLDNHESDLQGMTISKQLLADEYYSTLQWERLEGELGETLERDQVDMVALLKAGLERKTLAGSSFLAVMDKLKQQQDKPFLIVMDDVNCYLDRGHYFHMDYDEDVKHPIPYPQVSLFQPGLEALALSAVGPYDEPEVALNPIKNGAVIAAMTESHAVAQKLNKAILSFAQREHEKSSSSPMHVFNVPHFSVEEVDHMVAHYECIGLGRLRMDRGETVMNPEEVAHLRMISGGIGQHFMDACVI